MIRKLFKGEKKVAYGKTLETPILYEYFADLYEAYAEVVQANDLLSHEEVVKKRNDDRVSTARQVAEQKALDDAGIVKPTYENSDELAIRDMVKIVKARRPGISDADALTAAKAVLGIE